MNAFKRIFLAAMLSLVGCATVVCLAILLFGGSGYDSLGVTIAIALSLGFCFGMGMLAFMPFDKGRWRPLAALGITMAAVLTVAAPLISIWEIYGSSYGRSYYTVNQILGQILVSLFLLTGFLCITPAVLMPRLRSPANLVPWATVTAMATAVCLALLTCWNYVNTSELMGRAMVFAFILSGAGILAVLILARFFAIKAPAELTVIAATVLVKCPRCLTSSDLPVGESRCPVCKLGFKIELEEPRCPRCKYILHGLTRPQCPECGQALNPQDVPAATTPSSPASL